MNLINCSEELIEVPDQQELRSVQAFCEISHPYKHDTSRNQAFVDAMKEIIRWHQKRSPFYKNWLNTANFDPESLKSIEDCGQIPLVTASFFKTHEVMSIEPSQVFARFTSSGTTGQKSQIVFDRWSMKSGQRMLDLIFNYYKWVDTSKLTNYLLFSYETETDSKLGTAYTDNYLCKYAKPKSVFHALRLTGEQGHEFDVFGCIEALQRFEKEGLPVRIFGFPAFLHFTLERMKHLKMRPLRLSTDSLVFLGGGWKGHANKAIKKQDLYASVVESLGIPDDRVRDGFGAVEHPIPYIECRKHQFHVPTWSEVYIRDLKTLEVLGTGRPGFLHFVSPYITSQPAHSVLMSDLATLHGPGECLCGLGTPYFVVHKRAGTTQNRSCAIAASEMLASNRGRR